MTEIPCSLAVNMYSRTIAKLQTSIHSGKYKRPKSTMNIAVI